MKNYVEFCNGMKMPVVGLGTWLSSDPQQLEDAMEVALEAGYRHFDTAYSYQNEASVGKVLKKWLDSGKVKRDELFIVTKLPLIAMKPESVGPFLQKSLDKLQLDYVDLYLVHSPVGLQYFSDEEVFPVRNGKIALDMDTDHINIWKAMEKQVDQGKTKSIGLSNFNHKQIERVVQNSRIRPANLQVELHAYFQRKPLREVLAKHKITLCAYGPLGSPGRKTIYEKRGVKFESNGILEDPTVTVIAKNHGKTTAQVLLRFLAQQGIVVIPKSVTPARIKSNLDIFDFELTTDEMQSMNELDQGPAGMSFDMSGFPGADQHPEFPLREPF